MKVHTLIVLLLGLTLVMGCPTTGDDDDVSDDDVSDDDTGDDDGSPYGNDAVFVSQVVPTNVTTGAGFDVEITMENAGTTTWTVAGEYRLGSQNPQDNQTWATGRVDLDESVSIATGNSHTFQFALTAPATAGTYDFQWQMLQENVEWFGETTQNLTVEVEAGDPCSNGVWDAGETGLDCGGPCDACPAVELSAGNHGAPVVAATGDLVMVTFADVDDDYTLYYMCQDDSGWTSPQPVPGLGSSGEFSRMVTDSQGRIHLVVHQGGGSGRGVYHARFDGDSGCAGSWTTPTRADDGTRNSCWPAIAVDANDDPHVFWTEDYLQMQYNHAPGGIWGSPVIVIDTEDEQSCHGDITVDGTTAHVIWQEGTSPRLPTWSHWTGSEFSAPEALTNQFHNWPQIVADGHGRLHVLYTWRYDPNDVKYIQWDSGTWSSEVTVSTGATAWTWAHMEADDSGVLHATWSQTDSVEHAYYCIGDGSTGTFEAPRQVSTGESRHDIMPAISVDPHGRAHLVWVQVDDPWAEEPGQIYYRVVTWDDLAP